MLATEGSGADPLNFRVTDVMRGMEPAGGVEDEHIEEEGTE